MYNEYIPLRIYVCERRMGDKTPAIAKEFLRKSRNKRIQNSTRAYSTGGAEKSVSHSNSATSYYSSVNRYIWESTYTRGSNRITGPAHSGDALSITRSLTNALQYTITTHFYIWFRRRIRDHKQRNLIHISNTVTCISWIFLTIIISTYTFFALKNDATNDLNLNGSNCLYYLIWLYSRQYYCKR